MTLILSNADVEKLLTMPECIDALEESYVELIEGRGVNRTRSDCITPTSNPNAIYGLKSMDGVIPKFGIGAIRINSDIVTFPQKGNNVVREKVPAANGRYGRLARDLRQAAGSRGDPDEVDPPSGAARAGAETDPCQRARSPARQGGQRARLVGSRHRVRHAAHHSRADHRPRAGAAVRPRGH